MDQGYDEQIMKTIADSNDVNPGELCTKYNLTQNELTACLARCGNRKEPKAERYVVDDKESSKATYRECVAEKSLEIKKLRMELDCIIFILEKSKNENIELINKNSDIEKKNLDLASTLTDVQSQYLEKDQEIQQIEKKLRELETQLQSRQCEKQRLEVKLNQIKTKNYSIISNNIMLLIIMLLCVIGFGWFEKLFIF